MRKLSKGLCARKSNQANQTKTNYIMSKALGTHDYEDIFDAKVGQAKKMERCDLKLIICGDSAVGKSK